MKCNFFHFKLKDKSNINLDNTKILKIFKLSLGNNINILDYKSYNKNKIESLNKNLEIIVYFNIAFS